MFVVVYLLRKDLKDCIEGKRKKKLEQFLVFITVTPKKLRPTLQRSAKLLCIFRSDRYLNGKWMNDGRLVPPPTPPWAQLVRRGGGTACAPITMTARQMPSGFYQGLSNRSTAESLPLSFRAYSAYPRTPQLQNQ